MVAKYHDESIRSYDWGLVFGLWAALNVIRAFVIWSLSPLLRFVRVLVPLLTLTHHVFTKKRQTQPPLIGPVGTMRCM